MDGRFVMNLQKTNVERPTSNIERNAEMEDGKWKTCAVEEIWFVSQFTSMFKCVVASPKRRTPAHSTTLREVRCVNGFSRRPKTNLIGWCDAVL